MAESARQIVLLQPFEGFDVSIGTRVLSGFRKTSEWNGLTKLTDPDGRVLIISIDDKSDLRLILPSLSVIFGNEPGIQATIVKASPDLIELLGLTPQEKRSST